MKKRNLWNQLFHYKELKKEREDYGKAQELVGKAPELLYLIKNAGNLNELLTLHKRAWNEGFRNENLGPGSMFRCDDISKMTSSQVYLGDIYGLWTFNIPTWDRNSDVDMSGNGFGIDPNIKCYSLIMDQYKSLLRSNIQSIVRKSSDYIKEYEM